MATPSACGTNSTCLLEAILAALEEANNEFKWDLPSFIATLLLGLIALGYAAVPIIQGLLARLSPQRYNALAIGKWSQETTFMWSWSELRFLAVVRTPLLDLRRKPVRSTDGVAMWDSVSRKVNKEGVVIRKMKKRLSPDLPLQDDGEGPPKSYGTSTFNRERRPYAGWLKLLQHIYANDDFWLSIFENNLETPADIIPSELPAAHAFGTVETITALAILAGCNSIRISDGYPVLRGNNMQLEFRSHTTLGIIAVFTRVALNFDGDLEEGITSLMSWAPIPSDVLNSSFRHFQGNFEVNGKLLKCYQFDELSQSECFGACRPDGSGGCEHCYMNHWDYMAYYTRSGTDSRITAMLTIDIPRHAVIFPSRLLELHVIISCIATQSFFLRRFALFPEKLSPHIQYTDNYTSYPMMLTSPTSSVSLAKHISLFCPEDEKNKAAIARSLLGIQYKKLWHGTSHSWLIGSEATRPDWNLFSHDLRTLKVDGPIEGPSSPFIPLDIDSLVIIPTAVRIALDWLDSAVEFSKQKSNSAQDDRNLLLLQLYEIDFWLAKNRDAGICAMSSIKNNAFVLEEAYKVAQSIGTVGGKSDLENREKVFNGPVDQIWCMFEEAGAYYKGKVTDATNHSISPLKRTEIMRSRMEADRRGLEDVLGLVKERQDGKTQGWHPSGSEDPDPKEEKLFRYIWKVTGPGEEKGEAVIFHIALRAVLLGALLALGVDNSDVLQLETIDQIVPFM